MQQRARQEGGRSEQESEGASGREKEGARKKEEEVHALLLQKEAQDITSSTGVGRPYREFFRRFCCIVAVHKSS